MKPDITFKFSAKILFLKYIHIPLALFFCVISLSNASTLSGEEFKEYAPEQAYWVVSVTCDNNDTPRVIQRKTDGNQWCGKDIDGFCFDTKVEAGNKVCGEEFDNILEAKVLETRQQINQEQERQAQARVKAQQAAEDRRQAQVEVDRQLLEIEQEKLALRQQELKLQKRAVEIREALDELDN